MWHSDTDTVARNGLQHHIDPTKRGWLFLGEQGGPCDKACKFCYYAYQKNLIFFHHDTLLAHANKFRHVYGLEYCDISGGEATIYGPKDEHGRRPQLEALIDHCSNIGLKPTIITHGQNNTESLVKGVEDAGLQDWLISLHGLQSGHDRSVVGHNGKGEGGWNKLTSNLKHCTRPIRFNTTAQDFNNVELPGLATWLTNHQAPTVWNIIQFNPFFAWGTKEVIEFQARMEDLAPYIGEAVHIAESYGWEVNVRYFPFCVAAPYGFAKNCVTFYGTQYDHWEWCLMATNAISMSKVEAAGGLEAGRRMWCDAIAKSRSNPKCDSCRFHPICEGPSEQYQKRFGIEELMPMAGEPITDIAYFAKGGSYA
jgi:hypothetical protein